MSGIVCTAPALKFPQIKPSLLDLREVELCRLDVGVLIGSIEAPLFVLENSTNLAHKECWGLTTVRDVLRRRHKFNHPNVANLLLNLKSFIIR